MKSSRARPIGAVVGRRWESDALSDSQPGDRPRENVSAFVVTKRNDARSRQSAHDDCRPHRRSRLTKRAPPRSNGERVVVAAGAHCSCGS